MTILVCIHNTKTFSHSLSYHSDAVSLSSNNSNEIAGDFTESSHPPLSATSSGSSSTLSIPDTIDNLNNYSITIEINDSGKRVFSRMIEEIIVFQVSAVRKARNMPSMSYQCLVNLLEIIFMNTNVNGSLTVVLVNLMIWISPLKNVIQIYGNMFNYQVKV